MKVVIPKNLKFEYEQCKKLYEKNQILINDDASFFELIKNTFFYSFYENNVLVGCAYLYYKNEKLFLNGFANRKYYLFNVAAIKKIFDWFSCDIYAESIQKPAILLLFKCGFKKIGKNLYVHYKETSS